VVFHGGVVKKLKGNLLFLLGGFEFHYPQIRRFK